MSRNDNRIYVGNISPKVTEELIYELFLQAGPVVSVNFGKSRPFAFVEFKHECSVPYAIELMSGISLFGRPLNVNLPKGSSLMPTSRPNFDQIPPHFFDQSPQLMHPLSLKGFMDTNFNDNDVNEMDDLRSSLGRRRHVDQSMLPSHRSKKRNKSPCEDDRGSQNNRINYMKDPADLRNSLHNRRHKEQSMMPSHQSKRRSKSPSKDDMLDIPDLLGSRFDPIYSSSVGQSRSQHHNDRSRDFDHHRRDRRERHDGPYQSHNNHRERRHRR